MTLFRKVFQNQSRPATGDEALDDDALRDAFMQDSEDRVLPLDPFAVVSAEEEPPAEEAFDEPSEDEDHIAEHNDLNDDADYAGEVVAEQADADAEIMEDDGGEDEDSNASADIAAVLAQTRMMEEQPVDDSPTPESSVDLPDAQPAVPEPELSPDLARPVFPAAATKEDGPDLVAYARQQMTALSGDPHEVATNEAEPTPLDLSNTAPLSGGPTPAAGRTGRRAGRVKTRMLGFNRAEPDANDPFGGSENATAKPQHEKFPVGWLVVVEGPGIGHSFSIFTGASMIGRGDDQVIKLDFGDNSISRNNHAAIAYDEEENKFYIGHGGKSNIIRRNARPVLSTEELHHADLLRIGETTLRFVALCGSDFKWDMAHDSDASAF